MKVIGLFFLLSMLIVSVAGAQWVQLNGPEGGCVFEIYDDGAFLYAGLASAGVFRSSDGGSTWTQVNNGMGYQTTVAIIRSGSYLLASGTVGLYRSSDGGDTWSESSGLPTGNGVNSLATIGSTVFAGTSGKGVYVSTDNGGTWSPSSTGLPGIGLNTYIGRIVVSGSNLIVSATDFTNSHSIYRSTDLGATWTLASTGLPSDYYQYNAMASDGSTIYAAGASMYKSTNGGDSWSAASSGIQSFPGITDIEVHGSDVYAVAPNLIYRSTDGGTNWNDHRGDLPFMNFFAVELAGTDLYVGTIANGVYKSTDNGNTWSQMVSGMKGRDISGFLMDGMNLYANGNSIFKSTDGADSWTNIRGDLNDSSSQPTLVYADGNLLFERNFPYPGLERSTDGGLTWNMIGTGLSPFGTVLRILDSPAGLLTVANRIYRSADNGDSWTQVDHELGDFVSISDLARVGGDLYAFGMGVFKSTDEGTIWAKADSGFPPFFQVGALAGTGSAVYASGAYFGGTYQSTDGGQTWTSWSALQYTQILIHDNDIFFCKANDGIYVQENSTGPLVKISAGLPPNTYNYSLAIYNGYLYAGVTGNGVWKRPLSEVVGVRGHFASAPEQFILEQNYPNPFNPSTMIQYSLPEGRFVSLKIYNVLGEEVTTLVNGIRSAGVQTAEWNASSLPGGLYFARLTAGNFSQTRKMLLVK